MSVPGPDAMSDWSFFHQNSQNGGYYTDECLLEMLLAKWFTKLGPRKLLLNENLTGGKLKFSLWTSQDGDRQN
jgi:hypothetical protein